MLNRVGVAPLASVLAEMRAAALPQLGCLTSLFPLCRDLLHLRCIPLVLCNTWVHVQALTGTRQQ